MCVWLKKSLRGKVERQTFPLVDCVLLGFYLVSSSAPAASSSPAASAFMPCVDACEFSSHVADGFDEDSAGFALCASYCFADFCSNSPSAWTSSESSHVFSPPCSLPPFMLCGSSLTFW